MICPVELASDVSALQAGMVGDHAEHGFLHEGRDGAGDESTGSDFAGYGQENHAGGKRRRLSASVIGTCGAGGSATKSSASAGCLTGGGECLRRSGSGGGGGAGAGTVPGEVFRSEPAAFSREAEGRAPDRTQLQLGEGRAARRRTGGAGTEARGAPQTATAAAAARHAVAHRWQSSPLA